MVRLTPGNIRELTGFKLLFVNLRLKVTQLNRQAYMVIKIQVGKQSDNFFFFFQSDNFMLLIILISLSTSPIVLCLWE